MGLGDLDGLAESAILIGKMLAGTAVAISLGFHQIARRARRKAYGSGGGRS